MDFRQNNKTTAILSNPNFSNTWSVNRFAAPYKLKEGSNSFFNEREAGSPQEV